MGDSREPPAEWTPLLRELEQRHARVHGMGGAEKLAKRHAAARLDARQRVARFCDPGSFREIGALVGSSPPAGGPAVPADALVGGVATLDGRAVVVGCEDATVQGGSIGHGTHAKRVRLARLALQERIPLVMLLDGAGERVTNALERYAYAPNDLQVLAELSGKVPSVTLVMGASAGHGALTAVLADFVVMVEGAALFSAGPPLVEAALGERVTPEELGGARMHAEVSGVAHNLAPNEEEAFAIARSYLSYFPANAWEWPPVHGPSDPRAGERSLPEILDLVPAEVQRPYDVRRVLEVLVDEGTLLELQPLHGASLVTALARLGGQPVELLANQPRVLAGAIDRAAAEKAAHFLELADAFHLPVVFLTDNPGVLAGTRAEREGTLRSAARMYAAQAQLRSPKLHVTLRKAFGFGSSLMAMNPFDGQTVTLAFPGITLGGVPPGSGSRAAGTDPQARARLEAAASGAWVPADNLGYDRVIDPRELRNELLAGLRLAASRQNSPAGPVRHARVRP